MQSKKRIRQSCGPCRVRKTRCNDEQPCASCILRGTEAECAPAKSSHRRLSPTRSSREGTIPPRDEARTRAPSERESEPATPLDPAHFDNWLRIEALLPSIEALEILLEFLYQECIWLYYRPEILGIWTEAIVNRRVDSARAGSLCLSLAVSILLLGPDKQHLYQPILAAPNLHAQFFRLGMEFANLDKDVTSFEETQLLIDLYWFSVFAGNVPSIGRFISLAVTAAIRIGLLDEAEEPWEHLNGQQREQRRRAAETVIVAVRWLQMGTGIDVLAESNINVCRARISREALSHPVRLSHLLPDRVATAHHFRVFRIHGRDEGARSALWNKLFYEVTELMPPLANAAARGTNPNLALSAEKCYSAYTGLVSWRDVKVISGGFPLPQDLPTDADDVYDVQLLAQSLCIHTAIFAVAGLALRPWLASSEQPSTTTQAQLQTSCLETAVGIVNTIPSIRRLVEKRKAPALTPWLASNLFNAAITFAIPLLRAVKRYSRNNQDELVEQLPWSLPWSLTEPFNGPEPARHPLKQPTGASRQLPVEMFGDMNLLQCAEHMLRILDAMTWLHSTPMGKNATDRLAELVDRMGLRNKQDVNPSLGPAPDLGKQVGLPAAVSNMWDEIPCPPAGQESAAFILMPQTAAEGITLQGMSNNGDMPSWESMDFGVSTFEELMATDTSVWESIFGPLVPSS